MIRGRDNEMKIKIRHIDDVKAVDFCTIAGPHELDGVIDLISGSGGVYDHSRCETVPFHSYQLVLDGGEAYAEILIGEDEEPQA